MADGVSGVAGLIFALVHGVLHTLAHTSHYPKEAREALNTHAQELTVGCYRAHGRCLWRYCGRGN